MGVTPIYVALLDRRSGLYDTINGELVDYKEILLITLTAVIAALAVFFYKSSSLKDRPEDKLVAIVRNIHSYTDKYSDQQLRDKIYSRLVDIGNEYQRRSGKQLRLQEPAVKSYDVVITDNFENSHVRNRFIIASNNVDISHAKNCIIVAGQNVDVSHAKSVSVLSNSVQISHVNSLREQKEPFDLIIAVNTLEISHATNAVVRAFKHFDIGHRNNSVVYTTGAREM